MVDLGPEEHLGRYHGVFIGQVEFSVEHASFVGSLGRTSDLDLEVPVVLLVRFGVDAHDYRS